MKKRNKAIENLEKTETVQVQSEKEMVSEVAVVLKKDWWDGSKLHKAGSQITLTNTNAERLKLSNHI